MPAQQDGEQNYHLRYLAGADVSERTVEEVLARLRESPGFLRFSHQDWLNLGERRPNIFRFIATSSYEAAPDDPIQREQVVSAMMGMLILVQEALLDNKEGNVGIAVDEAYGDTVKKFDGTPSIQPPPEAA